MSTMNFSIPDDVKEAFNVEFEGVNKSAVVTELMRRAVEERRRRKSGADLVEQMMSLRAMGPGLTDDEIRNARQDGRP